MPTSIVDFVHGLLSESKQIEEELAVLSVSRIGRISAPGSLDFGGSEYNAPEAAWIEPVKTKADDEHGWWHLDGGTYFVELNETVEPHDAHPVVLQTWPPALKTGVSHDTVMITARSESPTLTLHVPSPGVSIKENARITAAIPLLTLTA